MICSEEAMEIHKRARMFDRKLYAALAEPTDDDWQSWVDRINGIFLEYHSRNVPRLTPAVAPLAVKFLHQWHNRSAMVSISAGLELASVASSAVMGE
jgi:hypothetical protein